MFSPYSFECVGYKSKGREKNCGIVLKNVNKQKKKSECSNPIFQILVYYYYKLSYTGI